MLFNFFKKHEKQNEVRQHLGGFQDEFSDNQKKAVMCSLMLIANSDGEFHRKEEMFFEQTATMLGYRLSGDYIDDLLAMGKEKLFQLLKSLDESQKDWYIITAFGMLHADGQALEVEFQYMSAFFEQMGISEQRFKNVLIKTELLMKDYM